MLMHKNQPSLSIVNLTIEKGKSFSEDFPFSYNILIIKILFSLSCIPISISSKEGKSI